MLFGDLIALRYAIEAHGEQKHGDRPYGCHLLDVGFEVQWHKLEEQFPGLMIAAFCHDLVEDTDVSIAEIRSLYGDAVAEWTWAVTDSLEGKNRHERKLNTYAKTRESEGGVGLKLCDRLANVKRCFVPNAHERDLRFLGMYRKEHTDFREALYREGEFPLLWRALDDHLLPEAEKPTPCTTCSDKGYVLSGYPTMPIPCADCPRGEDHKYG